MKTDSKFEVGGKELLRVIFWLIGFVLIWFMFLPIVKGSDEFAHYPPVYFYFAMSLLYVWVRYLTSKSLPTAFALKSSALIISTCFLFTLGAYFYNGKERIICNAAEYDYPLILNVMLDVSDQTELNIALSCAKHGENTEIINELTAQGANK